MAKKKNSKKMVEIFDGFNDQDKKRVKVALRNVFRYSFAHKQVVNRCLLPNGFSKCEQCKKKVPKVFVDHIKAIGEPDFDLIKKMFVSSKELQGLCKKCHDAKTLQDKKEMRERQRLEEIEKGFF